MNPIKRIRWWWNKQEFRRDLKASTKDQQTPPNVYDYKGTRSEFAKKETRIHRLFKWGIIAPAIKIAQKIVGKHLTKEIPNKPQFRELLLFDKAYEKTIEDWNWFFRINVRNDKDSMNKKIKLYHRFMKSPATKLLRSMKQLLLTVLTNDTAYMEFMNMLLFNINREMSNAEDNSSSHLMYISKFINDKKYFMIKEKEVVEAKPRRNTNGTKRN